MKSLYIQIGAILSIKSLFQLVHCMTVNGGQLKHHVKTACCWWCNSLVASFPFGAYFDISHIDSFASECILINNRNLTPFNLPLVLEYQQL